MEEYHVSFVVKGIRKDRIIHAADTGDARAQIEFFHYLDNQAVYIVTADLYKRKPLLNRYV
jgi:phage gp29-like protein